MFTKTGDINIQNNETQSIIYENDDVTQTIEKVTIEIVKDLHGFKFSIDIKDHATCELIHQKLAEANIYVSFYFSNTAEKTQRSIIFQSAHQEQINLFLNIISEHAPEVNDIKQEIIETTESITSSNEFKDRENNLFQTEWQKRLDTLLSKDQAYLPSGYAMGSDTDKQMISGKRRKNPSEDEPTTKHRKQDKRGPR